MNTGTGNKGLIPEREPERRLPGPRTAAGAKITEARNGAVVMRRENETRVKNLLITGGQVWCQHPR